MSDDLVRDAASCVICGKVHPDIPGCDERLGGKYLVVRELGRGGMGCVFEALNATEIVPGHPLNDRVAVKVLLPEYASVGEIVGRFAKEAQAAAALGGENIVKVHDCGQTKGGGCYLVMEYLVGEDCQSLLARHPRGLAVAEAIDIVVQSCHGLQHAHEKGLIHRDLKPANLFLTSRRDGTRLVKILDFGIAKHRSVGNNHAGTRAGGLLGTIGYMSPEQIRDPAAVDARSDVYALGVILYELLSGRRPFEASEADLRNDLLLKILYQEATPLGVLQPALPKPLCDLVHRALTRDPGDRPASVQALEDELRRFAVTPSIAPAARGPTRPMDLTKRSEETLAYAPTVAAPRRELTTNAPVVPNRQVSDPRDGPRSRRLRHGLTGAVLLSLALAGLGWLKALLAPASVADAPAAASGAREDPASRTTSEQEPALRLDQTAAHPSVTARGTAPEPPRSAPAPGARLKTAGAPRRTATGTPLEPPRPSAPVPAVASPVPAVASTSPTPLPKARGAFDDRK